MHLWRVMLGTDLEVDRQGNPYTYETEEEALEQAGIEALKRDVPVSVLKVTHTLSVIRRVSLETKKWQN